MSSLCFHFFKWIDTPTFFYEWPFPLILPYLRAGINALAMRKPLVFIRTSYTYFQVYYIIFKAFQRIDISESSKWKAISIKFHLETTTTLANKNISGLQNVWYTYYIACTTFFSGFMKRVVPSNANLCSVTQNGTCHMSRDCCPGRHMTLSLCVLQSQVPNSLSHL